MFLQVKCRDVSVYQPYVAVNESLGVEIAYYVGIENIGAYACTSLVFGVVVVQVEIPDCHCLLTVIESEVLQLYVCKALAVVL